MLDILYEHYSYYIRQSIRFWQNMGPEEYGGILILVGVVGWVMMRSKKR